MSPQALLHAPHHSVDENDCELALAFANRSAVLFYRKMYSVRNLLIFGITNRIIKVHYNEEWEKFDRVFR